MNKFCFLNGEILPEDEAKVSIFDIGILRGTGIYEAMPAFSGEPFRFADHWERFLDSAHFLNLNIPITEDKALKVVKELLERNGLKDKRANVKFILTGGKAVDSFEYNFETPTFYIFVVPCDSLPEKLYKEGCKLLTYRYKRDLPKVKTINYANAVNLQSWRKEEGATEILYTFDGEIFECTASNIFLVKGDTLITPDEEVLFGITRKVVLEIARESGLKIEERRVLESEIKEADEVFITSSFKDIVPVTLIDDAKISSGEVGKVTQDLMQRFESCIKM